MFYCVYVVGFFKFINFLFFGRGWGFYVFVFWFILGVGGGVVFQFVCLFLTCIFGTVMGISAKKASTRYIVGTLGISTLDIYFSNMKEMSRIETPWFPMMTNPLQLLS